jgi:hypothetical protein
MLMGTVLGDLLRALQRMNEADAWSSAVNKAVLDEIARLVTEDQLASGIDGLGRELGEYSDMSKSIRFSLGLQIGFIDLNLTGEFYDSITANLTRDSIEIDGEGQKPDQNLFTVFGDDILRLTEENLQFIIEQIKEGYLTYVHKALANY